MRGRSAPVADQGSGLLNNEWVSDGGVGDHTASRTCATAWLSASAGVPREAARLMPMMSSLNASTPARVGRLSPSSLGTGSNGLSSSPCDIVALLASEHLMGIARGNTFPPNRWHTAYICPTGQCDHQLWTAIPRMLCDEKP